MNLFEHLKAVGFFPSPLILEGESHSSDIPRLAQTALCTELTACGRCLGCKQVLKGFHPDWIRLSGDLKIDDLRTALRQLKQKPFQAKYRVLSIEDAQRANDYVQNALLKTLEEPLAHWIILLGTNSRWGLLPTIRSRCLTHRIPRAESISSLSPQEQKLFELIQDKDDLSIGESLEPVLKERVKAKDILQRLLNEASRLSYPGHWKAFAPALEWQLWAFTRNLNPKSIWDEAWSQSLSDATQR